MFLTRADLAVLLGLNSLRSVDRMAADGKLPAPMRIGRMVRYRLAEVQEKLGTTFDVTAIIAARAAAVRRKPPPPAEPPPSPYARFDPPAPRRREPIGSLPIEYARVVAKHGLFEGRSRQ